MVGTAILHYQILEKLGEGGMGVVYKAHDTRLDRDVALKFLPPHLAASEQDKSRFIQEARAAAALNHPNVCSVIDIADHDGRMFIVMEFVDGKTLRMQLPALSTKQAIDIGIQIADGLAAAHEKGIVHRDIKPENIMIRRDGIAQIMDFGLAKLRSTSSKATRLTKEGSTVGTAGYMSPEQVQGFDTDHRSDLFSFGVLMYEMLTGQMPFRGVHETALLYEIVNVDPAPMSTVKPELDPALDAVVLECLEKDPKERTQSASQISVDLKRYKRESSRQRASRMTAARPVLGSAPQPAGSAPAKEEKHRLFFRAGAAVSLLLVFAAGYYLATVQRVPSSSLPVLHTAITIPKGLRYADQAGGSSALSPDGTKFVFSASDSTGTAKLWVRNLRSDEVVPLPGTERAQYPAWSPGSNSVAFFADGKLKIVDLSGGPALALADAPFGRGIAWNAGGTILYEPSVSDTNLWSVSASGGTGREATHFVLGNHAVPRFPSFLPDGDHFVFSSLGDSGSKSVSSARIGSLSEGTSSELLGDAFSVSYARGYLFYLRQGILLAQKFDIGTYTPSGKPVVVQGGVNFWANRSKADFSASENGLLVYGLGTKAQANEFLWCGLDGNDTTIGPIDLLRTCSLSPDGTRIAYDYNNSGKGTVEIWVYDIGAKVKLCVASKYIGTNPIWSRDGKRIYYHAEAGTNKGLIATRPADGSGEEEILVDGGPDSKLAYTPDDCSPDGRWMIIDLASESGSELGLVDLMDTHRPIPVKRLGIEGESARFSPDGKWIAYHVGRGKTGQISISSIEAKSSGWIVANDAETGVRLIWTKGLLTYYSSSENRYNAIPTTLTGSRPVFGETHPLFSQGKLHSELELFAADPGGKRFLAHQLAGSGSVVNFTLITNWPDLVGSGESRP